MPVHSSSTTTGRLPVIAIVDDDPADVHALRHAFKIIGFDVSFVVISSGVEFVDSLEDMFCDEASPNRPDLVFLDINMPIMNGLETLRTLRLQKSGRKLPIIMYSTSSDHSDIERAYELGANSFVVKPHSLAGLKALAEKARMFWFDAASLPTRPPVLS